MKKLIYLIITAFFALALLAGCRVQKPVVTEQTTDVTVLTEVQWDTVVYTAPDSSSIKALLACDEQNQVYIKKIIEFEAGKSSKPGIVIKDNVLTADCKVDSIAVYLTMYRQQKHTQNVKTEVKTVYVEKELTAWQKRLIAFGWMFIASAAGLIVAAILYLKKTWPF